MEVTGRKDVQNGGRSILKMTTGFGLFSSLSKVKIDFFLLFIPNLSYFNSFKLPYKIRLLLPFVLTAARTAGSAAASKDTRYLHMKSKVKLGSATVAKAKYS